VTSSNFREDNDASGRIDAADVFIVGGTNADLAALIVRRFGEYLWRRLLCPPIAMATD
jgi:hypothetical protein